MITRNKRFSIILFTIVTLLSIPLIAAQFTPEVNWSFSDFAAMGLLLLLTGLTIEMMLRKVKSITGRFILFTVILATFFLIWIELAVGLFGTPFAGS